jgi:hypothetical protein
MDTYGHLFEGSDRDSAEKMERLFAAKNTARKVLAIGEKKSVLSSKLKQINA